MGPAAEREDDTGRAPAVVRMMTKLREEEVEDPTKLPRRRCLLCFLTITSRTMATASAPRRRRYLDAATPRAQVGGAIVVAIQLFHRAPQIRKMGKLNGGSFLFVGWGGCWTYPIFVHLVTALPLCCAALYHTPCIV
ncbi:hypothetical protein OsI_29121 [Oryza sativa Indica Group]|uniref:Uncharacterized protein n=1 Tax=Oryza sativa subsp. indica TaxID=39946 RepID=A2YUX0_ORYSI|nr:hypothetical protein OsI_29121 [Oryza sativa Indica Group]